MIEEDLTFFELCESEKNIKNINNNNNINQWTHVTAFFPIRDEEKNKNVNNENFFDTEFYLKYGKILLEHDVNMYIFTTLEYVNWVREIRNQLNSKTRIVTLRISELKYYNNLNIIQLFYDNKQRLLNCDSFKYTPLYYIIMWNKIHFLEEAMKENEFESENFSWIDFRIMNFDKNEESFFLKRIESHPDTKLHFSVMNHCLKIEKESHFIKNEHGRACAMLFYGQKQYLQSFVNWCSEKTKQCLFEHAWLTSEQNIYSIFISEHKEIVDIQIGDYVDTIFNIDYIVTNDFKNLEYCLENTKWDDDKILLPKYIKIGLKTLIIRKETMEPNLFLNVCHLIWKCLYKNEYEEYLIVLWSLYKYALQNFNDNILKNHVAKGIKLMNFNNENNENNREM